MNYFHMHAQMQLLNITEVGLFVSAEAAYPTHIQDHCLSAALIGCSPRIISFECILAIIGLTVKMTFFNVTILV